MKPISDTSFIFVIQQQQLKFLPWCPPLPVATLLSGCTESNPGQPACLITLTVDSGGTLRQWCHRNPQTLGTRAAVSASGGGDADGPHPDKVSQCAPQLQSSVPNGGPGSLLLSVSSPVL